MKCGYNREDIIRYADGGQSVEEMEKIKQHIDHCEECRRYLGVLSVAGKYAAKATDMDTNLYIKVIEAVDGQRYVKTGWIQRLGWMLKGRWLKPAVGMSILCICILLAVYQGQQLTGFVKAGILSLTENYSDPSYDESTSDHGERVEEIVESNLHIIESNREVMLSSNAFDYIKAKREEYDTILQLGDAALQYMLKKFSQTTDNGLKEWIMAKACCDILGEDNPLGDQWISGRDWFERYTDERYNRIVSRTELDLNQDGVNETILVRMSAGEYHENKDPGPFQGWIWEGTFKLEACSRYGEILSEIELNKAFGGEPMIFNDHFQLQTEDYNNDGNRDFMIGQYASSNGYVYKIFTVNAGGKVDELPVEGREIFNDHAGYSPRFEKVNETTFKSHCYDNSVGKWYDKYYYWDGSKFALKMK